ncbi:Signal transducing adaptor protein STAM/STAM2 [Ceraceosorus bombacis]|uniref:Signal transducing adaptor protein STAM/STAM2 n=1 Tax=Ceraceosorus bombacis TaxID=401625 RepID=A0A0P1BBH3_9BASI|nr:Signal transducing adaptor protein STAM/STAM2 [Ceraceosorus bombacis]
MKKIFGRKDAVTPYRDADAPVASEGHEFSDSAEPGAYPRPPQQSLARTASPSGKPLGYQGADAPILGRPNGDGQNAGQYHSAYPSEGLGASTGTADNQYRNQTSAPSHIPIAPRRRTSDYDSSSSPQASPAHGRADLPPHASRQPRQGSLDMRNLNLGSRGGMPAFSQGLPPADQPLRNGTRAQYLDTQDYATPGSPVVEPPTPLDDAPRSSPRLSRWRSLRQSSDAKRERLASRDSGADNSAFYPSYAPPDQARETHYHSHLPHEHSSSPGARYEPDLQHEHAQVKPKRKLFGFGRDKKDKEQEHNAENLNHAEAQESPATRLNRGSGSSQAHAPNQPAQTNAQAKEPAWYDLVTGSRVTPAKGEGLVHTKIGWLCARPAEAWDWSYLMSLVDSISHSEAAAKEAARALRKEFKYGDIEPRKRATKIWAVLTLNGSDRFKMQVADKKFLSVIEEVITSHKTPISVKEQLIEVFGMLAFEFKDDTELHSVTKAYNRVRPSDRPLDGTPLNPEHEIFRPVSSMPPGAAQVQSALRANGVQRHTPRQRKPRSPGEEMARLHRECTVARESAHMLVENLAEAGMDSALVAEFSAKTLDSEEFLMGQIPWATAQADRSRADLAAQIAQERAEGRPASAISQTQEERLLADLLDAHERVVQAREMLGHVQTQHHQEDEDERLAIERSRYEVRVDRSKLRQDAVTGDLYSIDAGQSLAAPVMEAQGSSSSSRPPSPAPPAHRPLPVPSPVASSEGAAHSIGSAAGMNGSRLTNPNAHTRELSASSTSSGRAPREARPDGPRPASLVPGGHALPHGPRPLPSTAGAASSAHKAITAARSTASPTPGAMPTAPHVAQGRPEQEPAVLENSARPAALPPIEALKIDSQAGSGTGGITAPVPTGAVRLDDDNESVIMTPVQPSAKALGKRRQLSGDNSDQTQANTTAATRLASSPRLSPVADEKRLAREELLNRPPPAAPVEPYFAAQQTQSPPALASNNPFLNHPAFVGREAQTGTNPFFAQPQP